MSAAHHTLYLCAPVNALVEGIYEEKIPLAEVKRHGDFGLGTFDHLDGEMVMLDGAAYQIAADGSVTVVGDDALTPFAGVTFYQPFRVHSLDEPLDDAAFQVWLQGQLPSPNIFYALRMEGVFRRLRARSVPKQDSYRPLVEVAHEQSVFEFTDIEGTLAGFYTPPFMASLNVPGLHLHFLSADRRHGGHLLACEPTRLRLGVQPLHRLELSLPMSRDYLTLGFHRDTTSDLNAAER